MPSFPTARWHLCDKYGYTINGVWRPTHKPFRIVDHNAQGYRAGLVAVLDGPREASWHFSVMRNGEVWQHMSTSRLAWHAGSFDANNGSIGIEHEGKRGQPLTSAQYQATLRLHKWIFETHGFGAPLRQTTLREHKEFNYTDCPGGRIPWVQLMTDLRGQEDDMTPEQAARLERLWKEQERTERLHQKVAQLQTAFDEEKARTQRLHEKVAELETNGSATHSHVATVRLE